MSAMPEGLPVPFEVVTETEVDSRGRVSLGRAGAEPGGRYRVARSPQLAQMELELDPVLGRSVELCTYEDLSRPSSTRSPRPLKQGLYAA